MEKKVNMQNRDYRFDNMKGIMIFLLLLCHFIEKMFYSWNDDIITKAIYYTVYLFHMPVFIFISGYYSKGVQTDRSLYKIIKQCLIPYIVFNCAYYLLESHGNIVGGLLSFTYPQWTLWYLLCLVLWKLFVRPLSLVKYALVFSILFSLYVGFTDMGYFLALGRTFYFFPYFLAGYLFPKEEIENIRSKRVLSLSGFVLVIIVSFLIQHHNIGISALYMAEHYSGLSSIIAVLVRLMLIITGFICIFGFISIVSDKHSIVSDIGKNSIVIFLIHSGIIRILAYFFADHLNNGLLCVLMAVLFSLIVCLLFGNNYTAKVYRTIIDNISKVFLKPVQNN